MKILEGDKLLKPFINKCEQTKDPYMIVHFSREDDYFEATYDFMDEFDAALVIKNLIDKFQISKTLLLGLGSLPA